MIRNMSRTITITLESDLAKRAMELLQELTETHHSLALGHVSWKIEEALKQASQEELKG